MAPLILNSLTGMIRCILYLVSMRHQPPDVNKQTVCGDAAGHEVMIQMTDDIQLPCCNLLAKTSTLMTI